jgi:protein-S-isoprenylcysteine O-methyltransferase Ste14
MRIPPLPLMLLVALGMWLIAAIDFPDAKLPDTEPAPRLALVAAMALAGLFFIAAAAISFRLAKTTLDPRDPSRTSALVSSGIFRYSRNPIYVGFVLWLVAWAIYLGDVYAFAPIPLFVFSMDRRQIVREEAHLRELFGQSYIDYCQRVRRWL